MTSPPVPYTPSTSFASFNPSSFPNHGVDTDQEYENISTAMTTTQARLAQIQRNDGALQNGIVNRDALNAAVAAGVNTPTTWATATAYTERDSVIINNAWYWATEAHTSGVFADDLADGLWELIFDFVQLVDDVVDPAILAMLSDANPAVPAAAASPGVGLKASREDHVHDIYDGSTPSAITAGAGATGVATAAARADHSHPYTAPVVVPVDYGQAVLQAGLFAL